MWLVGERLEGPMFGFMKGTRLVCDLWNQVNIYCHHALCEINEVGLETICLQ